MDIELSEFTKLILRIIFLFLIGLISSRYVKKIINKIFRLNRGEEDIKTESEQITLTVLKHTISVIQYVIWIIVFLSISSLLQMTAFVQIIAALGVILGYVARDFMNDFIMGLVVLSEQQFRVGDIVTINDKKGTVLEVGIRVTTIILENAEEKYIISNRLLTSVIVHPIMHPMRKRKASKKGDKTKDVEK